MKHHEIMQSVRQVARQVVDDSATNLANGSGFDRLVVLAELRKAVDRLIFLDMHPSRRNTDVDVVRRLVGEEISRQILPGESEPPAA